MHSGPPRPNNYKNQPFFIYSNESSSQLPRNNFNQGGGFGNFGNNYRNNRGGNGNFSYYDQFYPRNANMGMGYSQGPGPMRQQRPRYNNNAGKFNNTYTPNTSSQKNKKSADGDDSGSDSSLMDFIDDIDEGEGSDSFNFPRPPAKARLYRIILGLTSCGLDRRNLESLPPELLKMCEPLYCKLCAVHIVSFKMAKGHYTSKKHADAVSAWMADKTDAPAAFVRCAPRSKYCELCDVHITTKKSYITHYAGKSHMAVVSGRKPPKNESLLKLEAAKRVEFLIAREKRAYEKKTADEPPPVPLAQKTPPELYCELCDVAGTCDQQMIDHRKGKKHLTNVKLQEEKEGQTEDAANGGSVAESSEAGDLKSEDDAAETVEDDQEEQNEE